jgi:hypothetical protein
MATTRARALINEPGNNAGDSISALVSIGSITNTALQQFCSGNSSLTLQQLISFLNGRGRQERGVMQHNILTLADEAASDVADLASRFYDYCQTDGSWKTSNLAGRTLQEIDTEFPEFAAVAQAGKKTRDRKAESWNHISQVYSDIANNKSIKVTCTSDRACRSLLQLVRKVKSEGMTTNRSVKEVLKRLNQALLERLVGAGTSVNQGVSNKRTLLTADYNKAANFAHLNNVSKASQDAKAREFHLIENSDSLYSDPKFTI